MGCCRATRNVDSENIIQRITNSANINHIKDLSIRIFSDYNWERSFWREIPIRIKAEGAYDNVNYAESENFRMELQKLLKKIGESVDICLRPVFKGKQFPIIEGLIQITDTASVLQKGTCEANHATLFIFWSTWCEPSIKEINFANEMFEKHPKWQGKNRIVGINLDLDQEAPRKEITKCKWSNIEHYWAKENWGAEICQYFMIQGLPFSVLVDREGIIKKQEKYHG